MCLLLQVACLWGGMFPMLSLLSITVLVFCFDRYMPAPKDPSQIAWITRALVAVHFLLWGVGIYTLSHAIYLSPLDKGLIWISLGLYFGQVSNSNAHELIHSTNRQGKALGTAIYGSLLFGHHVSAHLRVHHVYGATEQDPNTARIGEGFWTYLARAWIGEYRAGKAAEARLHKKRRHPYVTYWSLAGGAIGLALLLGGWLGVLMLFSLASYAQVQLYLSDYVQHYGLRRARLPGGSYEPMGPSHSWNAPHWYSSAMMLNAPRHSDHHTHPSRAFFELRLDPKTMPQLPQSLPVMAVIALIPPLWRRIMDPRVKKWQLHSKAKTLAASDICVTVPP
jgi:alkane 1-monooxygenase